MNQTYIQKQIENIVTNYKGYCDEPLPKKEIDMEDLNIILSIHDNETCFRLVESGHPSAEEFLSKLEEITRRELRKLINNQ